MSDICTFEKELSPLILSLMKQYKITGVAAAVVENGEIAWSQGFGYSDRENGVAAAPDTLFKIGSITKVFTATAVMQLVERGQLDLDEPVSSYIPEFSVKTRIPQAGPVTVRDLMTHHSGLPCDNRAGFYSQDASHLTERFTTTLEFLRNSWAAYPRGHVFSYSNVAVALLGILVERISGASYEQYIRDNILVPLGMERTSFDYPIGKDAKLSKGYNSKKGEYEALMRDLPAGGLTSSALDMAKFALFAAGPGDSKVLDRETLGSMFEVQNEGNPRDFGFKMGLNWMLSWPSVEPVKAAWHDGGSIHYLSILAMLPGTGSGVVVLTNCQNGVRLTHPVADRVLGMLLQRRGISPSLASAAEPDDFDSLTCKYATISGIVELSVSSGRPAMRMKGQAFRLMRDPDGWYAPELLLFGALPIHMKQLNSLRVRAKKAGGERILGMMQIVGGNRFAQPVGAELVRSEIPALWLRAVGSYNAENDSFMLKSLTLVHKDDLLMIRAKARKLGNMEFVLRPFTETEAIIQGLGRFAGETVELENKEGVTLIKLSGLVFRKV